MKISFKTKKLLKEALAEDFGRGDVTSRLLIPAGARAKAVIVAREKGIFCGTPFIRELFRIADPELKVKFGIPEGKSFRKGQAVVRLEGKARSILKAERVTLNFLGRLSGIATLTHAYVERICGNKARVFDTRKTTPLLREFEKYAVKTGGGKNHRMGLYDAVFVKENHRRFGNLAKLRRVSGNFEIEVRNLKELSEALVLNPRVILFDNFSPVRLKEAVTLVRQVNPRILLEASGGITLGNISRFAATGVDRISSGALTHSAPAIDFSLLIKS